MAEGMMKRVGRKLKEVYGGANTYMPKKKKPVDNTRTASVKSGLKSAGITDEEMKRFMGKK